MPQYCVIPAMGPGLRFLGKIAEAPDCMRDATYWTYPVEQLTAIQTNPALMDDPEFNTQYACRLNETQWLVCRKESNPDENCINHA